MIGFGLWLVDLEVGLRNWGFPLDCCWKSGQFYDWYFNKSYLEEEEPSTSPPYPLLPVIKFY